MKPEEIEKLKLAGKIHQKVMAYAKEVVQPGKPLLEIAEKIEGKIVELGGKPAFPIVLCTNDVAAHATPSYNDAETAKGLLKVDVGVHIEGYVADGAFSIDLEDLEENKKIIAAAEAGLAAAIEKFRHGSTLNEVGNVINLAIESHNFTSIKNLTGHLIERYDLHAGANVPNYDDRNEVKIKTGLYACEPFATNGIGKVKDGKLSGIMSLTNSKNNVRDNFARQVLEFIHTEYNGLPFCSRWIHKKFGTKGLLALRQINHASLLHEYPQLVEESGGKVAQAEHSILILPDKQKIITTKE